MVYVSIRPFPFSTFPSDLFHDLLFHPSIPMIYFSIRPFPWSTFPSDQFHDPLFHPTISMRHNMTSNGWHVYKSDPESVDLWIDHSAIFLILLCAGGLSSTVFCGDLILWRMKKRWPDGYWNIQWTTGMYVGRELIDEKMQRTTNNGWYFIGPRTT